MSGVIGPDWFRQRIDDGEVVIIDGATGSELEARGVPMIQQGWSVMAQLEHPEILQQLHEDYIRAGASAVIANTFAAGRHLLEPGGLGDRVADAHLLAVEIAKRARAVTGEQVIVAGSISNYMADTTDQYWLDRLDQTYEEQVSLLAEAGVDVIALEMMEHPVLAPPAIEAALRSGLPVWLGLSSRRGRDGSLISAYNEEDIEMSELVEQLISPDVGLVTVMHTAVPEVGETLALVREHWEGPVGVYPESGYFIEPHWQFVDIIPPGDLVAAARGWVDQGVQVVGGCCGLGVAHIEALRDGLAPTAHRSAGA